MQKRMGLIKKGGNRRVGSVLVGTLIIMVAIGFFVAGLSMMQTYFLRALANKGSESQTKSGSEGVARVMVERLAAAGAVNLGVINPALIAQLNSQLASSGVLDSLEAAMDNGALINRDSTYYFLEASTDLASAVANRAIPSEGKTLQITSDMPRRGFREAADPAGLLGVVTGRVKIKALVRVSRRGATTTTARVVFYKVPPWQQAFYADSTANIIISGGSRAIINGSLWGDDALVVSGGGDLTVAGSIQATQGLLKSFTTTARIMLMPSGASGATINGQPAGLIPLPRSYVELGYIPGNLINEATGRQIGAPVLLDTYQGRVRIGGAFGAPLVKTRSQSLDRAGRGECDDAILSWPDTLPQQRDFISCGNGAGFFPTAQIKSRLVHENFQPGWITLGVNAPAGYAATLSGAITYWKYFARGTTVAAEWDRASADTIAYEGLGATVLPGGRAPGGAEFANSRIWRGIFPDARFDNLKLFPIVRSGASDTTIKTWRNSSNRFGYIVNLSAANLISPSGTFLSFKASGAYNADSINVYRAIRPGQEVVVLHRGGCLAGPLTIHSQLPVYIIPDSLGRFNLCAGIVRPVLIDAPLITILSPQIENQVIARNSNTIARWDSDQAGLPVAVRSYGDPGTGAVFVNGVFRSRFKSGDGCATCNGAWEQVPSVLGDWGRAALVIRGMVDARQNTDLLILRNNAGANAILANSVVQPKLRSLNFDSRLLDPDFQPPGSWQGPNIPPLGAWPGSSRTPIRQQNAWWGGYSFARLTGGYVTLPGIR